MEKARILLGGDHPLVLYGIRRLLENHHDVIGSASDGGILVKEAIRLEPEVIVLDVTMPILNGIDAARDIKKRLPTVKLVFISMHASAFYVRKAIAAGASAYVLIAGASEELLKAIDVARRGDTYFSPGLGSSVIEVVPAKPAKESRHVGLTTRQRQILQMIAEGKQNKEIAGLLFVSVRTVEFHRGRLMSRLGARTVAELIRFSIQEALICPTEPPTEN